MKRTRVRLDADFQPLEDRLVPATFGVPWADPNHVTLSFVPDGADTPLGKSRLAQTLTPAGTTAAWQREILRAFQTWAATANIDVGVVADGGHPLGARGAVQGDSRFGDIRVSAAPLPANVLASASPFTWTGTTLSGDLVFNSDKAFSIGERPGAYDLYSVALHEAGHAFGLDHSDACGCSDCTAASVMRSSYSPATQLAAEDVAALRALYGPRAPDAHDAAVAGGNDARTRATALARTPGSLTQWLATGDVTTLDDVDYYKFNVPLVLGLTGVSVRLKASEISLLTPTLTVYNSAGQVVDAKATTDPLSNDLSVRFNPLFGGTFYVKVEGATDGVSGVGGYKVAVDYLSVGGVLGPLLGTVVAVTDGHTDDTLLTALGLTPKSTTDARFDATYRGVIEDRTDVDTYKVRSGGLAAGTSATLNVMAWALGGSTLDPRVRVFDAAGAPVAFQVLANDAGLFSVQVPNAVAGRDYFVQVSAKAPGDTGSYFMAADFNTAAPATFDGVGTGTVGATPEAAKTLTISGAGLFQFALAASGGSGSVTMTVTDGAGRDVFSRTATGGQPPVTATQYLVAGTYTVRYVRTAGTVLLNYDLFLLKLSDGVGPYATTTGSSGGGGGSGGGSNSNYSYSGNSNQQTQGYGYVF